MKRNMKKVVAIAFMLGMAAITSPVEAKTSTATLPVKTADIALGAKGVYQYDTTRKEYGNDTFRKGSYQIPIKKAVTGAKYVCTTSDKKIATATVKDNRIYLTGLKAGTTKITCKQTVDGKTTVVGTMTVKVHNAEIKWEKPEYWIFQNDEAGIGIWATPKAGTMLRHVDSKIKAGEMFGGFYLKWSSLDKDVKYDFTSGKDGLRVTSTNTKIRQSSSNELYSNKRYMNTHPTKAGTYTLTFTQTYKKNKVTSSKKVTYYDSKAKSKAELSEGVKTYRLDDLIDRVSNTKNYVLEVNGVDIAKKNSILYTYEDEKGQVWIATSKKGTVKVKAYYYNATKKTKGKYLGTCEVTVK